MVQLDVIYVKRYILKRISLFTKKCDDVSFNTNIYVCIGVYIGDLHDDLIRCTVMLDWVQTFESAHSTMLTDWHDITT